LNVDSEVTVDDSDGKQYPPALVEHYDGNTHDVLANLCRLNGNIETHPQHGVPVNLFPSKGTRNFVTDESTGRRRQIQS
jgi:hypothetical protein